ncbi:SDR family oxidoreductase [Roseivirga sp. BDSF3-8]|uniref:SDR family oxidoreductase n=1 Tax=Roseivirga sp. BDSF3-8 TaxID=3241598 RepID=UPI003531C052
MIRDKICLITGANSGIGFHTALELAQKGAKIIMLCRNKEKAERAREDIQKVSGQKVALFLADLAVQDEIRQVSDRIKAEFHTVDVLINNAGVIQGDKREFTPDGLEKTFAVNHLAPFMLTGLLLPQLKNSSYGRIITVSSEAHKWLKKLDLNDLQMDKGYSGLQSYALSKLCNILFTRKLAEKLTGTSLTANTLHPGAIASNFGSGAKSFFGVVIKLSKPFMKGPKKGAETSVFLAASEKVEGVNGAYFKDKVAIMPSKNAQSEFNADKLWQESVKLTGVEY